MTSRLAQKIAAMHMADNYPQPLRLQPDYGERNAADFLGDRNVSRNTGYGDKLKVGPGNAYDEVVADNAVQVGTGYDGELEADFLGELDAEELESFEIVDDLDDGRLAEMLKESRLPSRKHNDDTVVDAAIEEWRENNPEIAEKFDSQKVHSEEEMREKMKQAHYEITDDIGLGRTAKDHEDSGSYMSRQNLREIGDMADFIVDDIGMGDLDDWVEDKISHAHSAMNDVARYRGYRDDHPHGEESFKFAGRKMTPFEIVTNWFAQAEEESEGEIEYMVGVDGDDEMSGDVEIFSGHDISSLIRDLERDLRWSNIEFSKSGRRTISWSLPTQTGGFEGEHFRYANDEIIDDLEW